MFYKEKRGYMTLEATMIMPLIIVGIVFVIYISFYLYDASIIRQISYVAALRASQQMDYTAEQMENYAKKHLEEQLEKRLLAIKGREQEIKVSLGKVKIKMSATVDMPFSNFISEKLNLWKMESETEVIRVNPVKIIRSVRGSDGS